MRVIIRICDERGSCLDVRHRADIEGSIIELTIDQAVKLDEAINDTIGALEYGDDEDLS